MTTPVSGASYVLGTMPLVQATDPWAQHERSEFDSVLTGVAEVGSYTLPVSLTWLDGGGSPGQNTWHIRTATPVFDPTEGEEVSGFIRDFYTALQGIFPDDLNIQMFGDLTGILGNEGDMITVDSWGLGGTGGTHHLPNANCLLANFRGDTGGRSGRGKVFLGPIVSSTAKDDGTPTTAVLTTLNNAISDLVDSSDSFGSGAVGIFSRKENIIRDITSGAASSKFAVLRSRRD